MDASKKQELITMFNQGMSIDDIATELEVSVSTVRAVLKENGLVKPKSEPTEVELQIAVDYTGDLPVPTILQKYHITYARLYTILSDQEVSLRKQVNAAGRSASLEAAIAMYKDGTPLWKIKTETGIAQPTLHAELHTRQIPFRRPR